MLSAAADTIHTEKKPAGKPQPGAEKTIRTAQKAAFPGKMLHHKASSPEKQNHLYQLPNSLIYAISFLSQPLIYFYCLTG